MFRQPHGNGSFRSTSWSQLCDSDLFFTVQKPGAGGCARALEGVQRLCPVLESCGSAAAQCAQHFRAESPLPLFIFAEAVCKTSAAGKEPIIPNTLQKQENGMLAGAGVLEPPASAAPRALRCYLVRFRKCCLDTLRVHSLPFLTFLSVLPAELMLKKSIYCIHLLNLLQWKMLILEPLMSYTENLYWAVVIHCLLQAQAPSLSANTEVLIPAPGQDDAPLSWERDHLGSFKMTLSLRACHQCRSDAAHRTPRMTPQYQDIATRGGEDFIVLLELITKFLPPSTGMTWKWPLVVPEMNHFDMSDGWFTGLRMRPWKTAKVQCTGLSQFTLGINCSCASSLLVLPLYQHSRTQHHALAVMLQLG